VRKGSLPVVIAILVLASALCEDAQASCNVIPDAESAEIGATAVLATQDPTTPSPPTERGLIGFKGALGRMDRIQLLPGQTESFRIQPDGQCIQVSKERLVVRDVHELRSDADLIGSDLVVSLLTKPTHGGGIQALVLGSPGTCKTLAGWKKSEPRQADINLRCESLPPLLERGDGGKINVRVRLPADDDLLGADGMPLRGSATIALTRGLQSRAAHEALLSSLAADGCAAQCSALGETGALACIDQFFAIVAGGTVVSDPIPCAVTIPPLFKKNDFMERCENPSSPDPDLAACEDKRKILKLWDDQCGGVHIPFDWARIRKDNSTNPPTDITRWVAGRSATSRMQKGNLAGERIWIPGREFIGTTPFDDAQGTIASIDWRKPEIDVWYPPGSPKEVGLRGTVDQADSIVHIFPRMPVTLACDGVTGNEACMGVEGGGGISCACGDRYPASCTCKLLSPPLFFACDGGDFDEMPCTRHAHCNSAPGSSNPNGTCSRQPTCQQDGQNGVWQSSGPAPAAVPATKTACWVNDTCQQAVNRPWCGYRLFDLRDRKDAPSIPNVTPAIELDADIVKGGRARRGVCEGDRGKACNHNAANGCDQTADEGVCRGYTLRAEGKEL
jgi:hypothetical protein